MTPCQGPKCATPNFARSLGPVHLMGTPSPMRFTFPQAVGSLPPKAPVPQPGLPPPHGINSHLGQALHGQASKHKLRSSRRELPPVAGSPYGAQQRARRRGLLGRPRCAPRQSFPNPHPRAPPCLPHGAAPRRASPLRSRSEKTQGLARAALWRHLSFQVPRTQACLASVRQN